MTPLPPDIINNPILSNWLRFAADGTIELFAGKVELGQGIATTQLQIAADELDVPFDAIRLCVGNTALCPNQGLTVGSLSTEVGGMALRRICAEVRQLFVQEAARRLQLSPQSITIEDGQLLADGIDTGFSYRTLAADVDLNRPAIGNAEPKPAHLRQRTGVDLQRPDLQRKLFGAAYLHDIDLPQMLHGRMVRPPSYAAQLLHVDPSERQKIEARPGVHTLLICGRYVGVCAEREEQAIAAAHALQRVLKWEEHATLPAPSSNQRWLRSMTSDDSVVTSRQSSTTPDLVHHIEVDYSRPFLAHASIGPACALAQWDDGRLTVWTHSQGSFTLRRELAQALATDADLITVIHADGAGCYGHNGADDAALDAALLAQASGRPVRLQWMREDEFAWSPCGSAMSIRIAAALDANGRIVRWHHQTWSDTHVQRPGLAAGVTLLAGSHRTPQDAAPPRADFPLPAGGGQRNAVPIYDLPSCQIDYHLLQQSSLRTSALRALGAYANIFAIESCMDELAALARQDSLAFRLAHLSDPRARAVLSTIADRAGWSQPVPPANSPDLARGRGLGFARYKNSGAYCAVVIEIEVTDRIRMTKIWSVVDAGEVISPDGLKNQIEGGILQAASWTLKEAITWDRFHITTRSWEAYPILRFDELPHALDVELIAHPDLPPLGAGECAAGPTAAALANALADAIGVRVRDLPLTAQRLQQAVLDTP